MLSELDGKTQRLEPKLLSGDRIAIGKRGLTFKHDSLLQAIERGFSMPELFPMLRNPLSAIQAIGTLKRIARHYDPTRTERVSLLVVLRAGLEALTVYLNHHPLFHGLFSDSSDELITFNLADSVARIVEQKFRWFVFGVTERFRVNLPSAYLLEP